MKRSIVDVVAHRDRSFDVVAVGNALVDVLARAGDEALVSLGLAKGAMVLMSADEVEQTRQALAPERHMSGGSAANTAVGLAVLGATTAFVGRVDRDDLGRIFTDDINRAGVYFRHHAPDREPQSGGPIGRGTGRCLVVVTPDAERSMATYLGVAGQLDAEDLDAELITSARLTYLEGYLWDLPATKDALRGACRLSHEGGNLVALSLSDPFVVERHREDLWDLITTRGVDVVFGNEEEVKLITGSDDFDVAAGKIAATGVLAACTRGASGSVALLGSTRVEVEAAIRAGVVDTTGAGDLYAAGFLASLVRQSGATGRELIESADLARCGALGSLAAAEIISHLGSRPARSLVKLAADEGLL